MTTTSDLVKRLRFWVPLVESQNYAGDILAAADRLEKLEAECERLRELLQTIVDSAADLHVAKYDAIAPKMSQHLTAGIDQIVVRKQDLAAFQEAIRITRTALKQGGAG